MTKIYEIITWEPVIILNKIYLKNRFLSIQFNNYLFDSATSLLTNTVLQPKYIPKPIHHCPYQHNIAAKIQPQ